MDRFILDASLKSVNNESTTSALQPPPQKWWLFTFKTNLVISTFQIILDKFVSYPSTSCGSCDDQYSRHDITIKNSNEAKDRNDQAEGIKRSNALP